MAKFSTAAATSCLALPQAQALQLEAATNLSKMNPQLSPSEQMEGENLTSAGESESQQGPFCYRVFYQPFEDSACSKNVERCWCQGAISRVMPTSYPPWPRILVVATTFSHTPPSAVRLQPLPCSSYSSHAPMPCVSLLDQLWPALSHGCGTCFFFSPPLRESERASPGSTPRPLAL